MDSYSKAGAMRNFFSRAIGIFVCQLLFAPMLLSPLTALAEAKKKVKTKPASTEEIYLYGAMGATYICKASLAKIDFRKAVGVAAATYAEVLNGRHGGVVKSAGKKKLTNKQLFQGAELQVVTRAMEFCPEQIPEDVKEKITEAMEKIQQEKKN